MITMKSEANEQQSDDKATSWEADGLTVIEEGWAGVGWAVLGGAGLVKGGREGADRQTDKQQ